MVGPRYIGVGCLLEFANEVEIQLCQKAELGKEARSDFVAAMRVWLARN